MKDMIYNYDENQNREIRDNKATSFVNFIDSMNENFAESAKKSVGAKTSKTTEKSKTSSFSKNTSKKSSSVSNKKSTTTTKKNGNKEQGEETQKRGRKPKEATDSKNNKKEFEVKENNKNSMQNEQTASIDLNDQAMEENQEEMQQISEGDTEKNISSNEIVKNNNSTNEQVDLNENLTIQEKINKKEEEIKLQKKLARLERKQKRINNRKIRKPVYFNILILTLTCIGLVGVLTGFIIWWSKNSQKIETPTNIEVIDLSNKTLIQVEKNPRAVSYEFRITDLSENSMPNVLKSKENKYDITEYLKQPKNYKIEVRIIGNLSASNSDWKQIEYKYQYKLETPVINYKLGEENIIEWSSVAYADSYKIYYDFIDNEYKSFVYTPSVSTGNITFDLGNLVDTNNAPLSPNAYSICVSAISQALPENTIESAKSNTLQYIKEAKLDTPEIISYNKTTAILVIKVNKAQQKFINKVNVNVGSTKIIVAVTEQTQTQDIDESSIQMTFDLSNVVSAITEIYSSVEVFLSSDNLYYTPSEEANIQVL